MKFWALCLCLSALPAQAQDFGGLARLDGETTGIVDTQDGLTLTLGLSQIVPFRAYTLDAPRRLVLDFRTLDFAGLDLDALRSSSGVADLRAGPIQSSWSRLVLDLSAPLSLRTAGMSEATDGSGAILTVDLNAVTADTFARVSGEPTASDWDVHQPSISLPAPAPETDSIVTVVIDPGHGGIDPGATRGTIHEADLMLSLAIDVAEALNRSGLVRAVLTRDSDVFVPLNTRMTIARKVGADLFISLHADALEEDAASGASVYTLSQEGEDAAAQRMAERHERGDLLAGLDLTAQDDRVATVLMDLARVQTAPQGDRFADRLVAQFQQTGARLNSRPRRSGRLAVLNAADFASVLVEVGFLSSARDRAMLTDPEARAPVVRALVEAVLLWAADEATRAPLVRQ